MHGIDSRSAARREVSVMRRMSAFVAPNAISICIQTRVASCLSRQLCFH